jgi:hypothetical protein
MSMFRPPLTEAEIWHTAWLMTALFGCAAEAHRAAMNHARMVEGSPQGEEAWRRVAGVLKEIRSQKLTRAVH